MKLIEFLYFSKRWPILCLSKKLNQMNLSPISFPSNGLWDIPPIYIAYIGETALFSIKRKQNDLTLK